MTLEEIEATFQELKDRQSFLKHLKNPKNTTGVGYFGWMHYHPIYNLDDEEIEFLKTFCINRIEALRDRLDPVLKD